MRYGYLKGRRCCSAVGLQAVVLSFLLAGVLGVGQAAMLRFATPLAAWPEMEAAVEQFEQEHPGIEVELVRISGKIGEDITRLVVAGNTPDVFSVHHDVLPEFLNQGLVRRLDSLFAADETTSPADYVGLDMGPAGYYALPLTVNTWFMWYNSSYFAEMGLTSPPPEGWSISEFESAAIKLSRDTSGDGQYDKWGYGGYDAMWPLNSTEVWLAPFGGWLFDDQGNPQVNSSEVSEALDFWADLIGRGMTQRTNAPFNDQWISGNIAMALSDRVWLSKMAQELSFDWGLAHVPVKAGVERSTVGTGHYFAISTAAKQPDEAWTFITWLTGVEGHRALQAKGLLPGCVDAFPVFEEGWDARRHEWNIPDNFGVVLEATAYTKPPSIVRTRLNRSSAQAAYKQFIVDAVFEQKMSIQQGLADLQRQLEALAAEARK